MDQNGEFVNNTKEKMVSFSIWYGSLVWCGKSVNTFDRVDLSNLQVSTHAAPSESDVAPVLLQSEIIQLGSAHEKYCVWTRPQSMKHVCFTSIYLKFPSSSCLSRGCFTKDKHATAHDQNHVTVHFSRVVQRLRWVVELFRVVATTENILLAFCRLGNSRISSFRKKVFNSPALSEREAKYVSFV